MVDKNYSKDFFVSIAYLFYAVAMADKKMVVEEKKDIVKTIKKYWLASEKFDSEELMYETLRNLISNKLTSEEAFEEFKNYVANNRALFTKEISQKLIKSSHSICDSFASKNKSELIILARIHKLLIN